MIANTLAIIFLLKLTKTVLTIMAKCLFKYLVGPKVIVKIMPEHRLTAQMAEW